MVKSNLLECKLFANFADVFCRRVCLCMWRRTACVSLNLYNNRDIDHEEKSTLYCGGIFRCCLGC